MHPLRRFLDTCPRGYVASMARHFGFSMSYLGQLADGQTRCSIARAVAIALYTNGAVTAVEMLTDDMVRDIAAFQSTLATFAAGAAPASHSTGAAP